MADKNGKGDYPKRSFNNQKLAKIYVIRRQ